MVYINNHIAQLCIINPRERVKLPTGGKGAQRQAHESLLQIDWFGENPKPTVIVRMGEEI